MKWLWIIIGVVAGVSVLLALLEIIPWGTFALISIPLAVIVFAWFFSKQFVRKKISNSKSCSLSQIFQDINNQLEEMPKRTRLEWDLREIRHQERKFKIDNKYITYISIFAPIQSTGAFVRVIYNIDEKRISSLDGRMPRDIFLKDPFEGFNPSEDYSQSKWDQYAYPRYPYYDRRSRHRATPTIHPNTDKEFGSDDYEFTEIDENKEDNQ
jgi:hypothetical protein